VDRPRRREEWIQVSTGSFPVEIRREGDKAAVLEGDLRCNIRAWGIASIGIPYEQSLPKLDAAFRCEPSRDPDRRLGSSYFRERLTELLDSVVDRVISDLSYIRLFEDPAYSTHNATLFKGILADAFSTYGFMVLRSDMHFEPLEPDVTHANHVMKKSGSIVGTPRT
jgi:hypothetical protein